MSERFEVELGGEKLTIETGKLAGLANGAVLLTHGDTVVLVTACMSTPREGIDFFPLTIDFEERMYAAGKIPGGFFKREGRASTAGILTMRLTDRPLRPLFPKGFRNEIQIVSTPLSVDQEHQPDLLTIIGASAALTISDIPFDGPVSGTRIGYIDGEFVINPTFSQLEESDLDIVVASTRDAVVMVEADAAELSEAQILEAIALARETNDKVIALVDEMRAKVGKEKVEFTAASVDEDLQKKVEEFAKAQDWDLVAAAKDDRGDARRSATAELVEAMGEEHDPKELKNTLDSYLKGLMRDRILNEGIRPDGRAPTDIRELSAEVALLPRTHGSGLFTRGETQVLTVATLGSMGEQQRVDGIDPIDSRRYMHHYNFPPYSVGETRPMRGPSRRDTGHGALAERALARQIPDEEEFPYTIRLVSEVLSSNGSTSMASTCGSTLALMDAGVPIKKPVGGIAMGLIKGEGDNYKVLTDIAGMEDHYGDMDFKVAGTRDGITALQMDIKVKGITPEIMAEALEQAKGARNTIIDTMVAAIPEHRPDLSPFAPRMYRISVPQEKIGMVIGPGGRVIRSIIEETGCSVDIEDDGTVFIGSPNAEQAQKAISIIEGLTKDVEVGETYTGKVTRTTNFGAFIEILPGKDGLVRLEDMAEEEVRRTEDVLNLGDEVEVMVIEVDSMGRVNLSRKAVLKGLTAAEALEESRKAQAASRSSREGGGGGRRDFGRGGGGRDRDRGRGGDRDRGRGGDRDRDRGRDRPRDGDDSRQRDGGGGGGQGGGQRRDFNRGGGGQGGGQRRGSGPRQDRAPQPDRGPRGDRPPQQDAGSSGPPPPPPPPVKRW